MTSILQQLAGGHLSLSTGLIWIVLALVLSGAGGALTGIVLAGKDLGNGLAALMGGMFGPTAAVPTTIAGLLVLRLL
jgi:hypothetical protein